MVEDNNLMLIKTEKGKKSKEIIIWMILSCLLSLAYSLIYWNKTIPFTDGWGIFYSELISNGKFPYRDFYVYLPPLNLLIDTILWKSSFGYLIIYRLYRVIEREILQSCIYYVLVRKTTPKVSCVCSFVGVLYVSATNFDLLGDYNQTVNLLLVLMCIIVISYVKKKDNKKSYVCLFLLGIMIGLSFLLKQTIFVATMIMVFSFLSILFFIDKKRGYIKSVLTTASGFMIPVAISFVILYLNGALYEFLNQVFFDVGAKGNLLTTLASGVAVLRKPGVLVGGIVFFDWLIRDKKRKRSWVGLFAFGTTLFFIYYEELHTLYNVLNCKTALAYFILVCVCGLFIYIGYKKQAKCIESVHLFVSMGLILLWIGIVVFKPFVAKSVNETTNIFTFMTSFCNMFAMFGVILFVYELIYYIKTRESSHAEWSALFLCGLIPCYYSAMTCVDYIASWGAFFIVPVEIAYLLSKKNDYVIIYRMIIYFCVIISVVGCCARKVANSYQWWGWSEELHDVSNLYSIDVKTLKGFRVSENEKKLYENITAVIANNSNEDDTIYCFPHMKLFNVLVNNVNMDVFVPIPFYDVCADDYAQKDAILLEENPPSIVVWCDMPGCMDVHEQIFRGGERLGQRDIARWFYSALEEGEYVLIGQYDNVFVYKYLDNEEIEYVNIQDTSRINESLIWDGMAIE